MSSTSLLIALREAIDELKSIEDHRPNEVTPGMIARLEAEAAKAELKITPVIRTYNS